MECKNLKKMDVGGLSGESVADQIFIINFLWRSLRENCPDAKWKKIKKKENINQEIHIESLLQWIPNIWSPLWVDTGKYYGREAKIHQTKLLQLV